MSFLGGLWKVVQGKPVYDSSSQPPLNPPPEPPARPPEDPNAPLNSALESPIVDPLHDSPQVDQQAPEPQQPDAPFAHTPEGEEPAIQVDDPRTFPLAYIKRTITKIEGPTMYVYCYITNESQMLLDIHKIELLGQEHEIRHPMKPGDIKEFLIYNGPLLASESDHQATLVYKTEKGEYFEAIHEIRFTFNNTTHTYSVDEFRLRQPVKRMALF